MDRSVQNVRECMRRAASVAIGKCGWCRKPLGQFKWLCDDCAAKHRNRQRVKADIRKRSKVMRFREYGK